MRHAAEIPRQVYGHLQAGMGFCGDLFTLYMPTVDYNRSCVSCKGGTLAQNSGLALQVTTGLRVTARVERLGTSARILVWHRHAVRDCLVLECIAGFPALQVAPHKTPSLPSKVLIGFSYACRIAPSSAKTCVCVWGAWWGLGFRT